jgi:phage terminase large subunit GpA-like protein
LGLLARYNEGDRRRWYWECPQCHAAFEPHRKLLNYPDSHDPMECAEQVVMVCPHDGFPMAPSFQYELNLGARWVKEGQMWVPGAREPLVGTPRRSPIASFWMFGPAAGFTDWKELVLKLRTAELAYERTLSEEELKTVITTDFGEPHTPKALEGGMLSDTLKERARHLAAKGEVPLGVRFLITTIDVQKRSFVIHTFGIEPVRVGEGWMLDIHHVDMRKVEKSRRLDQDEHPKPIDPASYPEDWDVLVEEAIERTYPLSDGSGRRMGVKLVACDSGGAASAASIRLNAGADGPKVSVTSNAYAFWRRLRDDAAARQHHLRFHLLKGEPSNSAPVLHKTLPDSQQKDRFAIARGDVPVWAVNSNKAKDQAFNMLGREEPGGQVHFPVWYDEDGKPLNIDWLYTQLTSEVRLPAGWKNPARRRNEAFDLLAYLVAFLGHPLVRGEHIDWSRPPPWAREWAENDMVTGTDGKPVAVPDKPKRKIGDIAGELG